MNRHIRLISIVAAAVLTACSNLPPATPGEQHWHMQGRIGLWQGSQQESSQITWLQCGDHYAKIRLTGPVGVGGAEIISDPSGAQLTYKGDVRRAASAEALAADIGWPVPVSALRHWLRGRAAPNAPMAAQLSATGQLSSLEQFDWQIQFARYQHDNTDALPQLIEAQRGDTRLKLIVKSWRNGKQECAQ
ncbi:lipoprotein insertase outer membrane protein LolB [Spongiibacter marinus]|uniref:lipoprotein insertase outer membrane protein LolB n=1 Tax=Spongiibacter marinus TaxID=354246 RepID=UPI0019621B46|nr:lipoprotein insertase outer membrane protein LolB [Spongiibacter marinus]MBM7424715.1 outer membrane lipoprotein LolB [Spongiibacter marinus]